MPDLLHQNLQSHRRQGVSYDPPSSQGAARGDVLPSLLYRGWFFFCASVLSLSSLSFLSFYFLLHEVTSVSWAQRLLYCKSFG